MHTIGSSNIAFEVGKMSSKNIICYWRYLNTSDPSVCKQMSESHMQSQGCLLQTLGPWALLLPAPTQLPWDKPPGFSRIKMWLRTETQYSITHPQRNRILLKHFINKFTNLVTETGEKATACFPGLRTEQSHLKSHLTGRRPVQHQSIVPQVQVCGNGMFTNSLLLLAPGRGNQPHTSPPTLEHRLDLWHKSKK